MSTMPPPYQYDPKAVRRAAVLQAKAQRDAYRAQRDLYRQQNRLLRRGSILGPILLTAFGVVALLLSSGRWSIVTFTGWYARWWPALLVLAGAILIAEWAFDQRNAQSATPPLRRRVGPGVVFALILAIFFGATSRTVHDNHDLMTNAFSINHDNLFALFSDKHDLAPEVLDETLPPLTPGLVLSIQNPHGDINITGKSNDGNLHITVNKQVYASDSTLQSKGDRLTPVFISSPNGLSLTVPTVDGGSADLTILVPESLALSLTTSHGGINVTGVKAPVTLTTSHGDVELQSISGTVSARVDHKDSSFSAHNITGDLTLKGNLDDVNLTDISGQTYMEGDFFGDSHYERLLGPVTFQSSKTHFTLGRINGNVDIDSSDISGSDLAGPINLRVKSRNISFDHVAGDLDITNSDGPVSITSSVPGNVTINNTNGPVNLSVPERAGYTVTAESREGLIQDDFNLPQEKTTDRATLNGSTGDGRNHLSLQTTHANVSLHKVPGTVPPIANLPTPHIAPPSPRHP